MALIVIRSLHSFYWICCARPVCLWHCNFNQLSICIVFSMPALFEFIQSIFNSDAFVFVYSNSGMTTQICSILSSNTWHYLGFLHFSFYFVSLAREWSNNLLSSKVNSSNSIGICYRLNYKECIWFSSRLLKIRQKFPAMAASRAIEKHPKKYWYQPHIPQFTY